MAARKRFTSRRTRPTVEAKAPIPEEPTTGRSEPHYGDIPLAQRDFFDEVLRRDPDLGGLLVADAQRQRGGTYTDLARWLAAAWPHMSGRDREALFESSMESRGNTVLRNLAQRQLDAKGHVQRTDEVERAGRAMANRPNEGWAARGDIEETRIGGQSTVERIASKRGAGQTAGARTTLTGNRTVTEVVPPPGGTRPQRGASRVLPTTNPLADVDYAAGAAGGSNWMSRQSTGRMSTAERAQVSSPADDKNVDPIRDEINASLKIQLQSYYGANRAEADAWTQRAAQAMGVTPKTNRKTGEVVESPEALFLRTYGYYTTGGANAMTARQIRAGKAGILPPGGSPPGVDAQGRPTRGGAGGLPVAMTTRAPVAQSRADVPSGPRRFEGPDLASQFPREHFTQEDEEARANLDPEETPEGPRPAVAAQPTSRQRLPSGARPGGALLPAGPRQRAASGRFLAEAEAAARTGQGRLPTGVRATSAAERAAGWGPTRTEQRGAVPARLGYQMAEDPNLAAAARGLTPPGTALTAPLPSRRAGPTALAPAGRAPAPAPMTPVSEPGYGAPMRNRPRYVPGVEGVGGAPDRPGRMLELRNPVEAVAAQAQALRDIPEEAWLNDPRWVEAQGAVTAAEAAIKRNPAAAAGYAALGAAQRAAEDVREELRREETGDWQLSQREAEAGTEVTEDRPEAYGQERGRRGVFTGDSGQLMRNREAALFDVLGSPVTRTDPSKGVFARMSGDVGALPGAFKETARDFLARTVGGTFATREGATARGVEDPDAPGQGTNLTDMATNARALAEQARRQAREMRGRSTEGLGAVERGQLGRRVEERDRVAVAAEARARRLEVMRASMGAPEYALTQTAGAMGLLHAVGQYQNPLFPEVQRYASFLNAPGNVEARVRERGGTAEQLAPHMPDVLSELFRAQSGLEGGAYAGERATPTGTAIAGEAGRLGFRPRGELVYDEETETSAPSGRWTDEQLEEFRQSQLALMQGAFGGQGPTPTAPSGRFQRQAMAPLTGGGVVEQSRLLRYGRAVGVPEAHLESLSARFGGAESIPVGQLPGLRDWADRQVRPDPELGIFSPMRRTSQWFKSREKELGRPMGFRDLADAAQKELALRTGWRPEGGPAPSAEAAPEGFEGYGPLAAGPPSAAPPQGPLGRFVAGRAGRPTARAAVPAGQRIRLNTGALDRVRSRAAGMVGRVRGTAPVLPPLAPGATPAYAGIGSRQTPPEIQGLMRRFAEHQARQGWTLRSGGAEGADTAFEEGALRAPGGRMEAYLPWSGFGRGMGFYNRLKDRVFAQAQPSEAAYVEASDAHPAWAGLGQGPRALHARNVHQVLGRGLDDPSRFVLGWTPDAALGTPAAPVTRETGGTGQAMRIASAHGVPVFNLANPEHRAMVEASMAGGPQLGGALEAAAAPPGLPGGGGGSAGGGGAPPPAPPGGPGVPGGRFEMGRGRGLRVGDRQTAAQAQAMADDPALRQMSVFMATATQQMAKGLGVAAPGAFDLLTNMGRGGEAGSRPGSSMAINPWRVALAGQRAIAGEQLTPRELENMPWLAEGADLAPPERMAHFALRAASHELTHTTGVSHDDPEAWRRAEEASWSRLSERGTVRQLMAGATQRAGGLMASPAFLRQAGQMQAQYEARRGSSAGPGGRGDENAIDLQEELAGPGRPAVDVFAPPSGWSEGAGGAPSPDWRADDVLNLPPLTPAEMAERERQDAVDRQRYGRFPQAYEDPDADPAAYDVWQQGAPGGPDDFGEDLGGLGTRAGRGTRQAAAAAEARGDEAGAARILGQGAAPPAAAGGAGGGGRRRPPSPRPAGARGTAGRPPGAGCRRAGTTRSPASARSVRSSRAAGA